MFDNKKAEMGLFASWFQNPQKAKINAERQLQKNVLEVIDDIVAEENFKNLKVRFKTMQNGIISAQIRLTYLKENDQGNISLWERAERELTLAITMLSDIKKNRKLSKDDFRRLKRRVLRAKRMILGKNVEDENDI